MRHKEILIPGTMLQVNWSIFHKIWDKSRKQEDNTWKTRPAWSPMIVCEYNQLNGDTKFKWKKLMLNLYDVSQMKYIEWNYQFCLDAIEEGKIEIVK